MDFRWPRALREPTEHDGDSARARVTKSCFEWVEALVTSLITVVIIFTFLFRIISVSGTSMYPTLHNEDRVVITNLFYDPQPGDIVVISHAGEMQEPLIKRVIAVEGQTLKIDFDKGEVYVDGVLLNEPYINSKTTKRGDAEIPEVIPEGYVFVMGDNRNDSLDSRFTRVGLIDKRYILGKAQLIVFPFNRLGGNLYS